MPSRSYYLPTYIKMDCTVWHGQEVSRDRRYHLCSISNVNGILPVPDCTVRPFLSLPPCMIRFSSIVRFIGSGSSVSRLLVHWQSSSGSEISSLVPKTKTKKKHWIFRLFYSAVTAIVLLSQKCNTLGTYFRSISATLKDLPLALMPNPRHPQGVSVSTASWLSSIKRRFLARGAFHFVKVPRMCGTISYGDSSRGCTKSILPQ